MEARRKAKSEQIHKSLLALPLKSRIRVRFTGGAKDVTLLKIHPQREAVELLMENGSKKEMKWTAIQWGSLPTPSVPVTSGSPIGPLFTMLRRQADRGL